MADAAHSSFIAPDDTFALIAVISGLAWLGFWADGHRIARRASGVLWVLTAGLLLSNTGLIPLSSPVYDFVGGYLMPMAVPLLLFKANLRVIFRQGGLVLPIFLLATVTTCIGSVAGFYLFDLGEHAAQVAGIYTGAWIGGVVNFLAIAEAVELTGDDFTVALSASSPVSIVALMMLVAVSSSAAVRRHIPMKYVEEAGSRATSEDTAVEPSASGEPPLRLGHVAAALAISAAICAVSAVIAGSLGIPNYKLFVITILAVALANAVPRPLERLEGDFSLGMLVMYLFFAIIGASTNATAFVGTAPVYFFYGLFIVFTQLALVLVCAKIFRFDLAQTVIAVAAAVIGSAATAALAATKGWKTLVTPGITTGILGYLIANFIGIAIYRMLS